MRVFSAVLVATSLGCSVPTTAPDQDQSASHAAAATTSATIRFGADGSVKVDGALRAGGTVDVVYDPARLPTCRGTQGGIEQWGLGASWDYAGTRGSAAIAGLNAPASPRFTIALPVAGDMAMWFENGNRWGCHEWDSAYGANYHFTVLPPENAPGWMGNVAEIVSRATCGAIGCDADRKPLDGFRYDTWARQRAAVANAYFDVWKQGVTDWDNPDLWKQLDVTAHYKAVGASSWQTAYVPFERRVGNDARYAQSLRAIDPLGGRTRTSRSDCPEGTLTKSADGQYVDLDVEIYFVVNGVELRPTPGGTWKGTFEDYADLYAPCF